MKICGLTLNTNRSDIFEKFYQRMNPKPDHYVIYNDYNPIADTCSISKLLRVAKNYNEAKKQVPNDIDYVLLIEDDFESISNIVEVMYNSMEQTEADCITTITNCRRNRSPMCWDENLNTIHYGIGIKKVYATSLNCVLIKKTILDRIVFIGYDPIKHLIKQRNTPVDFNFFLMLNILKYSIYCNFDIPTIHGRSTIYKGRFKKCQTQSLLKKMRSQSKEQLLISEI